MYRFILKGGLWICIVYIPKEREVLFTTAWAVIVAKTGAAILVPGAGNTTIDKLSYLLNTDSLTVGE